MSRRVQADGQTVPMTEYGADYLRRLVVAPRSSRRPVTHSEVRNSGACQKQWMTPRMRAAVTGDSRVRRQGSANPRQPTSSCIGPPRRLFLVAKAIVVRHANQPGGSTLRRGPERQGYGDASSRVPDLRTGSVLCLRARGLVRSSVLVWESEISLLFIELACTQVPGSA